MRNRRPDDETAHDGFALVAVLVFMLVVSAIVVPFALEARTRLMVASNEAEQQRLALVADGLVNVVSAELFDGLGTDGLSTNGEATRCRAGHMTIETRVQDHAGLIDLNAGDADLLARGFASLGFGRPDAETLARSVISFRTPASAFSSATEPMAPLGPREDKHAPFESVAELQEFTGLASTPLPELYQAFTVDLKRGSIDLANAPKRLRDVFGTGDDQSRTNAPQGSSTYSVEITARRDGSGIVGRAGFIVGRFAQLSAGFRRVSQLPAGDTADSAGTVPPPPAIAGCDALFGGTVAGMLGRWAS